MFDLFHNLKSCVTHQERAKTQNHEKGWTKTSPYSQSHCSSSKASKRTVGLNQQPDIVNKRFLTVQVLLIVIKCSNHGLTGFCVFLTNQNLLATFLLKV